MLDPCLLSLLIATCSVWFFSFKSHATLLVRSIGGPPEPCALVCDLLIGALSSSLLLSPSSVSLFAGSPKSRFLSSAVFVKHSIALLNCLRWLLHATDKYVRRTYSCMLTALYFALVRNTTRLSGQRTDRDKLQFPLVV